MTISNLTEMAESYPKRVENTVGKREIVHYEQFLLFPQCFQRACFPGVSKFVIVWEWANTIPSFLNRINLNFDTSLFFLSANPFHLDASKILNFVNGLALSCKEDPTF